MSLKPRSLRRRTWMITRFLRHFLVRPIARMKLFTTHDVSGLEFIPPKGGAVVALNHPSTMDPLAVGAALSRNVAFLAKAELWRITPLRFLLNTTGQIPVARGDRTSGEKAQASALKVLQHSKHGQHKGGLVLIFPEGGCTPHDGPEAGTMRSFKKGVWYLALESGRPVIPGGISGTERIRLRPSSIWRRKKRPHVTVHFGAPLYAADFTGPDAEQQFLQALREQIEQLRTSAEHTTEQEGAA